MGRTIKLRFHEGNPVQEEIVSGAPVVTRPYRALVPMFKQGREWQPGEVITMPVSTGQRFVEIGEAEEIDVTDVEEPS